MSLDIHSPIIEGLNKFVEMIVAPINARLEALEQPQAATQGMYTQAEVDRLLAETRQMCAEAMDQKINTMRDGLRDYVNDAVTDKLNDDLTDAVKKEIEDFDISATITVRR